MGLQIVFKPRGGTDVVLAGWDGEPGSGHRDLRMPQERLTRSVAGLRWTDQCREDRRNCCGRVSFRAKRSHASIEDAFQFICDLQEAFCEGAEGELVIQPAGGGAETKTFPNAVWRTLDPWHSGTLTEHSASFETSEFEPAAT